LAVGAAPTQEERMPEYLIFFNQQWVPDYPEGDWPEIGRTSKAVVAEIADAGELVFAGGLEEIPAIASADYADGESIVSDGPYAETKEWLGGFTIVDVQDDDRAKHWAGRIAVGCRWPQEVRKIGAGSFRG
jgi:hypothetical protein